MLGLYCEEVLSLFLYGVNMMQLAVVLLAALSRLVEEPLTHTRTLSFTPLQKCVLRIGSDTQTGRGPSGKI